MAITARRLRSWYLIARAIPLYAMKAATEFGFHPLQGARALLAALRTRYTPQEAYRLGLLQPGSDARTDTRFLSSSRSTAVQLRFNPSSWRVMLDDKSIFYRYCLAAGLPVPRLLGIFFRRGAGWSFTGACPEGRETWVRFFEEECPEEFVIKPSLGRSGRGVRIVTRTGGGFDVNGTPAPGGIALYEDLMSGGLFDSFVIQERIHNHSAITALSGSATLQTARVFTVVGKRGTPELFYAFFKIIVGGNLVDNSASGTTGNFTARINTGDGTLQTGMASARGTGFGPVASHPGTGLPLEGFRLPFWPEVREVTLKAAPLFLPLRSIGWDVAMTKQGPVLIEGNFNSDPPNSSGAMREFLDRLNAP